MRVEFLESAQRYHERMWTAIATCDKQERSFFQFLHESLTAKLTGVKPPTLLPTCPLAKLIVRPPIKS